MFCTMFLGVLNLTDGIAEAENRNKELFGTKATSDGILKVFNSNYGSSLAQKVDLMLAEVRNHTKGAVQNDDITMLLVEYRGPVSA